MTPTWTNITEIAYRGIPHAGCGTFVMNTPNGCIIQECFGDDSGQALSVIHVAGLWFCEVKTSWIKDISELGESYEYLVNKTMGKE